MTRKESDKIISEQNKSTEEILKAVAKVKSDYHELCNLKDMRIAELEKENAELKEKLKNQKADYETYYESCYNAQKRAEKKHTNARELLKRWLKLYNTNTVKGIIADTEKFISEVEK